MSQEGGGSAGPQSGAPQPGAPRPEAPQPGQLRTRAEYVAALRALRTWSGLTYRELEAKATAHADSLPASTIATTLGRASLPRERFVDAFTRACGLADQDADRWLEARRRIATDEHAPPAAGSAPPPASGDTGPPTAPPARGAPRWRWAAGLVAAVGIGVGGTLGVQALSGSSESGEPRAARGADPIPGLDMKAVGSWARIHPARTPDLCVSEGTDRSGSYRTAVAAQQLCARAEHPRVFLEPVGDGAVQIQWHHPEHGIGCLTALRAGPGRGLLEPRDNCADDDPGQRFRLEPAEPVEPTGSAESAGRQATPHFRIRPDTGQCLALRDEDTAPGAEIVQRDCSDAADQEFRIALAPPP
ncbi:XRE family transcriptional regulator [Streptomyces sp. 184]|uniref:XRE family transcriptional regulator n=1 Tax=Streptomyces sp. 184 TaxID=1827526 RepID=UPI0038923FD4